jgi:ipoprotein LpqH
LRNWSVAIADVDADVTFADGVYTITGTARGSNPDDPSTPRTAPFRIEVRC